MLIAWFVGAALAVETQPRTTVAVTQGVRPEGVQVDWSWTWSDADDLWRSGWRPSVLVSNGSPHEIAIDWSGCLLVDPAGAQIGLAPVDAASPLRPAPIPAGSSLQSTLSRADDLGAGRRSPPMRWADDGDRASATLLLTRGEEIAHVTDGFYFSVEDLQIIQVDPVSGEPELAADRLTELDAEVAELLKSDRKIKAWTIGPPAVLAFAGVTALPFIIDDSDPPIEFERQPALVSATLLGSAGVLGVLLTRYRQQELARSEARRNELFAERQALVAR